jgi:hypothetical protein
MMETPAPVVEPFLPLTRWTLERAPIPVPEGVTTRYLYRVFRFSEEPPEDRGQPVALLIPEPQGGCRVLVADGTEYRFGSLREARGELWLIVPVGG